MVFKFYNTCLNSFNISSLFFLFFFFVCWDNYFFNISWFLSIAGNDFTILSPILFSINSLVAPVALWTTFLEEDFKASNSDLVAVSNNYFPYLLDRLLANDKNPYPFIYFLIHGSIENNMSSYSLISNIKLNFET